jgi:hypothetical protein
MSARVATEARSPRIEGCSCFGGGRNGGRESGSQYEITEWKPTRPGGRRPAVFPRLTHTLSRISFGENPGNHRSDGPGKTAQLDQQVVYDDQRRLAEASNHHLGFPMQPTATTHPQPEAQPTGSLLSLTAALRRRPRELSKFPILLVLTCFLVQIETYQPPRELDSSRVKYQRSFILSERTLPSTNAPLKVCVCRIFNRRRFGLGGIDPACPPFCRRWRHRLSS